MTKKVKIKELTLQTKVKMPFCPECDEPFKCLGFICYQCVKCGKQELIRPNDSAKQNEDEVVVNIKDTGMTMDIAE